MKLSIDFKNKVREAILSDRENYGGSDADYAKRLNLKGAILSRLKKGEVEKLISDTQWLVIAHQLGVQVNDNGWKVARTQVYTEIEDNLLYCKTYSKSMILVDDCGIGKTFCARHIVKQQKNAKAKAAYRQKYESDFIIADAAARYFRENGISKLPSYKALQAEIETLIQEKNSGYNDYRAKREEYRRLQTVKGNIDQILHRERKPVKRQEQER